MKIINDDISGIDLDSNEIESILAFKDKLETTQLISSNAVISLENLIDRPIITSDTPINSFTSYQSKIGVEKVLDSLNKLSLKKETVTVEEIIFLLHDIRSTLKYIKRKIDKLITIYNENSTTLNNADTLSIYEDDRYVDLRDTSIFNIINRPDMVNRLNLDTYTVNQLLQPGHDSETANSNLLLMLTQNKMDLYTFNTVEYTEITYNMLLNIFKGSACRGIDKAYDTIDKLCGITTDDGILWNYDVNNRDMTTIYKRLSKYKEYLNDQVGELVLGCFSNV